MTPPVDTLMQELDPSVGALLTRHLETAREWFPHAMVPYSRGRDFVEGEEWSADDSPLPEAVRSALLVNILTEDNLPYYYHSISGFGGSEAWQEWSRRWTAEEGRHDLITGPHQDEARAQRQQPGLHQSGSHHPVPPRLQDQVCRKDPVGVLRHPVEGLPVLFGKAAVLQAIPQAQATGLAFGGPGREERGAEYAPGCQVERGIGNIGLVG